MTSVDVTEFALQKFTLIILASNEEKKNAMIALRGAAGFVRRSWTRIQLLIHQRLSLKKMIPLSGVCILMSSLTRLCTPKKNKGIELLENIVDIILDAEQIAILTHTSADGDALGSSFGLAFAMEYLGKNVSVFLEEPIPKSLDFLPGQQFVSEYKGNKFELCICLDTSDMTRLGKRADIYSCAQKTITIDHHTTNTIKDGLWIDQGLLQQEKWYII